MDFVQAVMCKNEVTPVLLLAIHQELVEQEEDSLLNVSCRYLQQNALHEHLCAGVCDVGALKAHTVYVLKNS